MHAYAPIGHEARYFADISRGATWSICAATTIGGWLPCTGVKAGYWNREDFLTWLSTKLLPCIREQFGDKPIVVIMDNLGLHVDDSITETIEGAGYIVRYLPPYSPDFNPIEMSFHILKS